MRHKNSGRQFSRNSSHRRAMLRSLTANLIAHERIETTDAKAKELRRVAERVITKARRLGAVAYTPWDKLSLADRARRQAAQKQVGKFLQRFAVITQDDEDTQKVDLVEKVFVDLAKRYKDRAGGYTRIIKVGNRRGDNAPVSIIELIDDDEGKSKKASAKKTSKKAAKAAAKTESKAESEGESTAKKTEPKKTESKGEEKAEGEESKAKSESESAAKKKAAKETDAGAKGSESKDEKKATAKKSSKKTTAKSKSSEKADEKSDK